MMTKNPRERPNSTEVVSFCELNKPKQDVNETKGQMVESKTEVKFESNRIML